MGAAVMTMNKLTLGIALPIYNERNRITQVFAEVETWAQRREHWQFLFVDDGSVDETSEGNPRHRGMVRQHHDSKGLYSRGLCRPVRDSDKKCRADISCGRQ
jgi:hypothetical protein